MEYIINVELNGNLYKTIKSKKEFNWNKLEEVESEIKSKYNGQQHISSCTGGNHGYYIGFQEKEGIAFCYRYNCIHITDFVDIKGTKISIGDKLISKFETDIDNPTIYEIYESGWFDKSFYIRMHYSRPGFGTCWKDIRNVTQDIINTHGFIKYKENGK